MSPMVGHGAGDRAQEALGRRTPPSTPDPLHLPSGWRPFLRDGRFLVLRGGERQYDLWRVVGVMLVGHDTMLQFDSGHRELLPYGPHDVVLHVWKVALAHQDAATAR